MKFNQWIFIVCVFVFITLTGKPQEITPQAQQQSVLLPAWQEIQTPQSQINDNTFEPYYTPPPPPGPPDEPFASGPWIFRPQFDGRLIYATALLARSNDVENTSIAEISPGLIIDLTPHWEFSYLPTIRFYSNQQFHNEFNNTFTASGVTDYRDWIFGFSQNVVQTSQPNLDTGEQTDQEAFLTQWSAYYPFNSRMSTDMLVSQNMLFTSEFNNSRETTWLGWFNYKLTPRLLTGVGGGPGYVNVDLGSDQIYEQLLARIGWHPDSKFLLSANGGFQERETIDGTRDPTFNPVFGASAVYYMTRTTTISASASQTISPSYFAGLDTETTSLSASLSQRFFKKYYLSFNGSYNKNKFVETDSGVASARTDDYYTFGASIGRGFGKRGSMAIGYQYNDQKSTEPGFSYKGSQFSFELSYRY